MSVKILSLLLRSNEVDVTEHKTGFNLSGTLDMPAIIKSFEANSVLKNLRPQFKESGYQHDIDEKGSEYYFEFEDHEDNTICFMINTNDKSLDYCYI